MKARPKAKRKSYPKPSQDECLSWLLANHPSVHQQAMKVRDWVWLRVGFISQATAAKLSAYGFREKKTGYFNLPDGSQAKLYHSCQGKWIPRRGRYTPKRGAREEEKMSKADALKLAGLITK